MFAQRVKKQQSQKSRLFRGRKSKVQDQSYISAE